MSILIICQKLAEDDDLLGAFVAWVRSIAHRTRAPKHNKLATGQASSVRGKVYVLCLGKGEYNLPDNCEVYSMGKERNVSRVGRWVNFVKLMFKLMPKCDVTFSHMCPIFAVASWLFVKLFGKKATLWYAHGRVSWKLRLAEKAVDVIFTSTVEGCRLSSKKIKVVGQGVDVEKFKLVEDAKIEDRRWKMDKFQMVSIGRIAPSKDYETMVKAIEVLVKQGVTDIEVKVIGKPGLEEDEKYFEGIKKMVREKGLNEQIKFIGAIPNKNVVKYYQEAVIYLNMSQTGSLDRAIVEAMACGCVVLTCNEGAGGPLGNAGLREKLMYPKGDFEKLAGKIKWVMGLASPQIISNDARNISNELAAIGEKLRREVVENHSVSALGGKIVREFDKLLKLS